MDELTKMAGLAAIAGYCTLDDLLDTKAAEMGRLSFGHNRKERIGPNRAEDP